MHHSKVLRILAVGFSFLGVTSVVWGQAPLPIEGTIADRSTYNYTDNLWFRVPATAGYFHSVSLDGKPVPTDLAIQVNTVDYHEISVSHTNISTLAVTNRVVRFIIQSDRGDPEKGLIKWTPYPFINSTAAEFAGAHLHVITPMVYPQGLELPVIAWVDDT